MHEFDSQSHVPLILHCGHTFCKKCIEETERKMGALQCSLCRGLDFREISLIKKNLIVFQNLCPTGKTPLVPCSKHTGKESVFFCLTDNIPFCSKCATMHKVHDFYDIDDHVITQGTDIELNKKSEAAEALFREANEERKKVLELYNSLESKKNQSVAKLDKVFDELIQEIKNKREEFVSCLNGKYNSSARKFQKVIESCDEIIIRKKNTVEELIKAKKKIGQLANTARYKAFTELENLDLTKESINGEINSLKQSLEEANLEIIIDAQPLIHQIQALSPGDSQREEVLL